MNTFTCTGFRNVSADSADEAAGIFAERLARRRFGKRGYCRTMRLDSWTENGHTHTFEVFIGYDVDRNTCSGFNEWLHVHHVASA
jgi:hypothetical protein